MILNHFYFRAVLSVLVVCASAPCAAQTQQSTSAAGYNVQAWSSAKPVPALRLADLSGKVWRLADLRGKAVLINFWASWCEPCRAEMPSLQRLADQHPQDLVVLAVNLKESTQTVQQFVQRTALTLPVLPDPQGATARAWGVTVFPSTVLIDAQGKVHSVVQGELDWTGPEAKALLAPLFTAAASSR